MPCDIPEHNHQWPQSGALHIENCERFCDYCPSLGPRKQYSSLAATRQHVLTCHMKTHPRLTSVTSGKGGGSRRRGSPATQTLEQQPIAPHPVIHMINTPAFLLWTWPNHRFVKQGVMVQVMIDLHAHTHLMPHAFDAFHLLVWRHILSKDIPNLQQLAKTVSPYREAIPLDLVEPITSFLATYGNQLWPEYVGARHHLTHDSLLFQQGYWLTGTKTRRGPVWPEDGCASRDFATHWRNMMQQETGQGTDPTTIDGILHSPLGRLIKLYVFAALHLSSTEPKGYTTAAACDTEALLRAICGLGQDIAAEGSLHMQGMMNAEHLPHGESAVQAKLAQYREETVGLAGLPFPEG